MPYWRPQSGIRRAGPPIRKAVLIIIAALLLTVSGCRTGSHELDERAYVYTIGVDRGVTDKLRFTFQFPTFSSKQGQKGNGGSEQPQSKTGGDLSTITIDAPTIYACIAMLYSNYSRRLNFTHASYLIISEEVARDSVESFINGMTRAAEIRRTMYVIITRGRAMDFIKEFRPFAGASVSKSQEMFMQNANQSSLYEGETYNEFANRLKCTKCQATATMAALNSGAGFKENGPQEKGFVSEGDFYAGQLPHKSPNKFEFVGAAIFNGATMVGELNGNETRSMLMLRGVFRESQMVIPDPADENLRVGIILFQKRKPDIGITFDEGKVKIHARIHLEGALQNVQNTGDITQRIKEPEEAFARFIKDKLDQTVKKCQELNCEVFDFGYKASRQFRTIQDWERFNWLSNFKNAEVTTEVDLIIRRTGTIIWTEDEKKTE